MLKKMFFIFLSLVFFFSCGIKGLPLPPIETIEDKVNAAPMIKSSDNTPAVKK